MRTCPTLAALALACFGVAATGPSLATAQLGGVAGVTFGAGTGSCNRSQSMPTNTLQDTFAVAVASTCIDGATASASARADAALASVGVRSAAGGLAAAGAFVSFHDTWLLTVAPATLPGTFRIPVNFKLEGSVSPGSFARLGGNFLGYSYSTRDLYGGLPASSFAVSGNVNTTGSYLQNFAGTVDFRYLGVGSALPTTAEVEMTLFVPQVELGSVDFFNSASIGLVLPAGWSATTSSGLALPFTVAAVPEASSAAMLLLGLASLGGLAMRRRSTALSRAVALRR